MDWVGVERECNAGARAGAGAGGVIWIEIGADPPDNALGSPCSFSPDDLRELRELSAWTEAPSNI